MTAGLTFMHHKMGVCSLLPSRKDGGKGALLALGGQSVSRAGSDHAWSDGEGRGRRGTQRICGALYCCPNTCTVKRVTHSKQ